MFKIDHVAITVTDIENSTIFYGALGFEINKDYESDDKKVKIRLLKLGDMILEIFCYKKYKPINEEAKDIKTDIYRIGTRHFALNVDSIEEAKEFVLSNDLAVDVDIKEGRLGRRYFFINDPDGILIEIIEK